MNKHTLPNCSKCGSRPLVRILNDNGVPMYRYECSNPFCIRCDTFHKTEDDAMKDWSKLCIDIRFGVRE